MEATKSDHDFTEYTDFNQVGFDAGDAPVETKPPVPKTKSEQIQASREARAKSLGEKKVAVVKAAESSATRGSDSWAAVKGWFDNALRKVDNVVDTTIQRTLESPARLAEGAIIIADKVDNTIAQARINMTERDERWAESFHDNMDLVIKELHFSLFDLAAKITSTEIKTIELVGEKRSAFNKMRASKLEDKARKAAEKAKGIRETDSRLAGKRQEVIDELEQEKQETLNDGKKASENSNVLSGFRRRLVNAIAGQELMKK